MALHAQSDVIRGRITGPDSLPVERATITVTSLTGNITRNARTDKNGRFTITFPGDEGDYMVSVAALGFTRKRFEIKRTGDQDILVADARLSKSAAQLDAVKVQANRDKPQRDANGNDIGGSERSVNATNVSADSSAISRRSPRRCPACSSFPAPTGTGRLLGARTRRRSERDDAQRHELRRQRTFRATRTCRRRSRSRPYDVSRGNFSGGMLSIRTGRASNYIVRTTSANLDAPAAQWTDRAGQALHQQYANVSLGGLLAGPIQPDKSFFNLSYQLGRRQSDLQSLLTTDALGLQTAGISSDSANRLLSILSRLGVPSTVGAVPSNRYNDQALGARQHGLHAADVDDRPGVQRDVQRQLEPLHGGHDVAERTAGAQRRSRVVERRRAGHVTRTISASAFSARRRSG